MKKLPLGMQSFRDIIEDGCVYADKTKYVYDLINESKYYFLSRPRRFGKSLLLSTIDEAFGGDRELFKGLFLYDSGYGFEKHPVIRLDMNAIANKTLEDFNMSLTTKLKTRIKKEGFEIDCVAASDLFMYLIEGLYEKYGKTVVVLIDEYDKPILDHIDDIGLAEAIRKDLRGFYGILKSLDQYLRFTFITGITKFTKTSIFSELNNLRDITLDDAYSNICGIEVGDLDKYFHDHIEHLATIKKFERYESITEKILAWYDGYSWNGEERVLNPFSLLSFFVKKSFSIFWYASGSPKFLIDLIKRNPEVYVNLNDLTMGEWELDTFDIDKLETEPLLFQTGYLTVKDVIYDSDTPEYLLGIPNFEVRESFNLNILAEFTESGKTLAARAYRRMKEAIETGNPQGMLEILKGLFASIPYQLHIGYEAYYHSIFYCVMNLLGFEMSAEVSVSGGIVDGVLEHGDKVYVMEMKYRHIKPDASPEEKLRLFDEALDEGMRQIAERGYCGKYEGSGKKVYQMAFAFLGRSDIEMAVEVLLPNQN